MDGAQGEGPRGAWGHSGESGAHGAGLALSRATVKWAWGTKLAQGTWFCPHVGGIGSSEGPDGEPPFTERLSAVCVLFKASTAVSQINADDKCQAQPLLNERGVIRVSGRERGCVSRG